VASSSAAAAASQAALLLKAGVNPLDGIGGEREKRLAAFEFNEDEEARLRGAEKKLSAARLLQASPLSQAASGLGAPARALRATTDLRYQVRRL
jgi:hypothetical protein